MLATTAVAAGAAGATAAATAHPARAQPGPREFTDNTNAWYMYFGDHAVTSRWAVHAEAQVRRSGGTLGSEGWQQLLLRPGVIYTITPQLRVTAGYAYIDTWPYGGLPAARKFGEHRTWQQVQATHATGRLQWQHRYRLEQRWVDVPLTGAARAADGDFDQRYTNRMRYLARVTVPLRGRTLDPGELYVSAYDEIFVNWGRNVGRNVFDQNRLYGAVGWRANATTRLEAGFLQQLIFRPDGVQVERNNTLQLAIFQNAPLFRPRAR